MFDNFDNNECRYAFALDRSLIYGDSQYSKSRMCFRKDFFMFVPTMHVLVAGRDCICCNFWFITVIVLYGMSSLGSFCISLLSVRKPSVLCDGAFRKYFQVSCVRLPIDLLQLRST